MKTIFRIIKIVLIIIVSCVAIAAAFIWFLPIPSYENKAPDMKVQIDSAHVEEGARIASMLCVECHLSDDGKLGGGRVVDANEFGEIYAPNITQSEEHGISKYTDGELAYLIRTGIRKDGRYAPPYMPKLPHLSDDDMNSIIAFLRSDHPLVQPSDKHWPDSKPNFLAKFLVRVAFHPFDYPTKPIVAPPASDKVAFGRYIALAKFECFSCHSENFKTNDYLNPEKSKGFFGGGNPFKTAEGKNLYSANLTLDETGLGKWTEADFIKAVKSGIRPSGETTKKPMIPYARMTDEEAAAVWAYLNTLPKIKKDVGALPK